MQPQQYERTTDFTDRDGDDTDHSSINAEFDAVALTTEQIRENLALIQRDDGALKNGIVTADALDDSAFDAVLINVNEAVQDAQQSATSALTSATTALSARDAAITAKTASETARDVTILNANNASASALAALNSQNAAATSQSDAAASKAASASSQTAAAASATSAATSATTATTQAGIATTKAADAAASATASASSAAGSQTAKTASENARDGAQTARAGAEAARDTAVTAKDAAQVSQSAAASSASSAGTSATSAGASAASAATSEANALASKNAAAASQTAAATSETNALTYKNAAAASQTAAAASEAAAAASQVSAASSAAAAASSYDSFDDRYLGPKATAPTLDNDGNALLIGALYFNTTTNAMQVYGSSGWTAAGSSVNGTSRRFEYVATAGQTTFTGADSLGNTLAYDAGYVDVYLNGARLKSNDFTASSGTSIVLAVAAALNDELNIVAFGTFNVANMNGNDLQAGTVTYAKIQNVSAGKVLGRDTSGAGVVQELPISVDAASGNVTFNGAVLAPNAAIISASAGAGSLALKCTNVSTPVEGYAGANAFYNNYWALGSSNNYPLGFVVNGSLQGVIDTSYNFKFNSGYGSAVTAYGVRAWASWGGNGTTGANATIAGSGNVSSVYKNSTGSYRMNFTSAMPDTGYAAVGMNGSWVQQSAGKTTTYCLISSFNSTSGSAIDTSLLDVAIIR